MEATYRRHTWLNVLSLLLAFPAACFIMISFMKYVFNMACPYDYAASFPAKTGIKENPGWNINLLILFGPLIAFLLTIFRVLKISWQFSKEQFEFHFIIRKNCFPLMVSVLNYGLLLTLFICLAGENY